jgi:transposase
VDFRKQINGLAELVEGELALDPFSAKIFAFTNRRRDVSGHFRPSFPSRGVSLS